MEYKITHKVDSHAVNPRYQCLLVDLLREPTFHFEVKNGRLVKADLMPTNSFTLELVTVLANAPGNEEFREQLFRYVVSLPLPRRVTTCIGGHDALGKVGDFL